MQALIAFKKSSLKMRVLSGFLLLYSSGAWAAMNCTFASTPTLNFGTVSVLTAPSSSTSTTMSVTCRKGALDIGTNGWLCLRAGDGSAADLVRGSRNTYQPRLLKGASGSNYAGFQLRKTAGAAGQFWGTYAPNDTPNQIYFDFTSGRTQTRIVTFYGTLETLAPAENGTSTLQTIVPDSYSNAFSAGGGHTQWNSTLLTTQTVTDQCGPSFYGATGNFPFTVAATVLSACLINGTTADIDFGTQVGSATNLQGATAVSVQCTRTTPYFIGLRPSNGSTTGAGVMSATSPVGNTDTVPYQLRKTTGMGGTIWGNTATSLVVGNGVAGTGFGSSASAFNIYATVPAIDRTPGNYQDTVTITVNY